MKIAVTFFSQKREEKIYKKIRFNQKSIGLNQENLVKIKRYQILIILIISIVIAFNNSNIIYLATNISKIENIDITKESIIALNGIANSRNYKYSKLEEKEDINIIAENSSYQKLNVCGVDIINYSTNRNIDFAAILNGEQTIFEKDKDEVLLYTTHTSESYANSEKYQFEYTSPRRTTDGKYNMLAISSTLASNLNNKGINTICSLTPHDYGEYNSAYTNSRRTMTTLLAENSNISIAIDVHRDAIEDLEFAPKTNLKGYDVASLMFVMGIGYEGQENPYYAQNLRLALQLQILANKIYPGLFRTMIIRNSIYNQDLQENSLLVEVGASGNTIDEANIATRCLANLLNLAFKD